MTSRNKSTNKKTRHKGRVDTRLVACLQATSAFKATTLPEQQVGVGVNPSLDDCSIVSKCSLTK